MSFEKLHYNVKVSSSSIKPQGSLLPKPQTPSPDHNNLNQLSRQSQFTIHLSSPAITLHPSRTQSFPYLTHAPHMRLPPNPSCQNRAISLDGRYKAGSSRSTALRINYAKSFGEKTHGMLMDCQGGNPCAFPPSNQRLGSQSREGSRIPIYYK
nr:hypothetical protein [Tanacetum cinerariifolium]